MRVEVAEVLRSPQEPGPSADTEKVRNPRGLRVFVEGLVQRVLIVEDSPTMRALLSSALEELETPVKITEAASGFDALRLLPRERFDLIVTDINMPDINGLELVAFVKNNQAYASIPLVIVSTEGSERDRDKGLGLGADAYLVKPFEAEALREVACDLLANPQRNG